MAGNDHTLKKTPKQWEEELEVSAGVLMTTYGWSHPELHSRFEEIVKRRISELDAEYNRMVEKHNSTLSEQIRDALRWGDLETVTQKRDGQIICSPNQCFYREGGSFAISAVTVTDSFGNKFQFENLPINPEIEPSGRHWCSTTLYTPSWNWHKTPKPASSEAVSVVENEEDDEDDDY